MSSRKIVAPVVKGVDKPTAINATSHSPLWSNVRFASPPGLKENKL